MRPTLVGAAGSKKAHLPCLCRQRHQTQCIVFYFPSETSSRLEQRRSARRRAHASNPSGKFNEREIQINDLGGVQALETVAVVFDLVKPFVAFRRPGSEGRQRRLDEIGKGAALCASHRARQGQGRAVDSLNILAPGTGKGGKRHEDTTDGYTARSLILAHLSHSRDGGQADTSPLLRFAHLLPADDGRL